MAFTLAARPLFFLYGDSITQLGSKTDPLGWVARLQESYCASYRVADVLNRGYSGYNTRWALMQLPYLIAQTLHEPTLVTLFFGANDSAVPASKQHVPINEYKINLEKMPVWDAARGGPESGMRELERARQYAEAVCELADRLKCKRIDLFSHIHSRSDWRTCLSDGLHLSASGNDVLYERVCEVIAACSPNLKPESAPAHFPLWAALAEEGSAAALIPSTSSAYGNSDAHKKRRALDSA